MRNVRDMKNLRNGSMSRSVFNSSKFGQFSFNLKLGTNIRFGGGCRITLDCSFKLVSIRGSLNVGGEGLVVSFNCVFWGKLYGFITQVVHCLYGEWGAGRCKALLLQYAFVRSEGWGRYRCFSDSQVLRDETFVCASSEECCGRYPRFYLFP